MEDDILDRSDIPILFGLGTAGMGRRDHARVRKKTFVKRQPVFFHAMDVSETMQIQKRWTVSVLKNPDFPLVDFEEPAAQGSAPASRSLAATAKCFSKNLKESSRRAGATFRANKAVLLRVSSAGRLPIWNWMRRFPAFDCSTIFHMRR